MRKLGFVGSLAALAISAPLAAQGSRFRTDDVLTSARIPQSVQDQNRQRTDRIPPGQLPPAGMCRIWIDGVPPGRQPAPTDCQTAVATKPANARILWGDQGSFPGKGKGRASARNGSLNTNQSTVRGKGRGRGNDDANDDGDDDDRNGGASTARNGQWPATSGGVVTSRDQSEKSLKSKPNKGRGRGGD